MFYADVFLLQNFMMDLIALTGVNYFLRRRRKYTYLVFAAALGAVIGLFLLLTVKNRMVYAIISHFVLNTGIILGCFGCGDKREFWENWLGMYLVTLLFGGVIEWLDGVWLLSHNRILLLLLAILGVGGMLLYLMKRRSFGNHILSAMICKRGRQLEVRGYLDSGNQLRDPYTGKEVCIMSKCRAQEFFDVTEDRFRLIPYRSLGENEGLLWVTDIDELLLYDGHNKRHFSHVAVGIAEDGILEGKEYDLILHASFL